MAIAFGALGVIAFYIASAIVIIAILISALRNFFKKRNTIKTFEAKTKGDNSPIMQINSTKDDELYY